jgi:hypothetical protein
VKALKSFCWKSDSIALACLGSFREHSIIGGP